MSPGRFLRDYWQKRPLLVRGALTRFRNVISANDLAGLACMDGALARLVLRDAQRGGWSVRNGPFTATTFKRLPRTHWTLLVQDVDKWDGDVAALLDGFAFLPAWRIDDVMVSYATDGGGVGAHVDQYDVFLVQASGRRRWRISTASDAPGEFRDDVELKLLREFTPTHDWLLEPGDMLYLPPGVPHDGVAVGECLTASIGMRAPSAAELILDYAETIAEPLGEERRFVDPDLRPAADPHEIDAAALRRALAAIAAVRTPPTELGAWFGRFITRYRSAHVAVAPSRPIRTSALPARLATGTLVRNPWSRTAWTRRGRRADLFVAGERFDASLACARLLAGQRTIDGAALARVADPHDHDVIAALLNAGHFRLLRSR
jgi:50S ribosomal protein L16 3-hydroxylase